MFSFTGVGGMTFICWVGVSFICWVWRWLGCVSFIGWVYVSFKGKLSCVVRGIGDRVRLNGGVWVVRVVAPERLGVVGVGDRRRVDGSSELGLAGVGVSRSEGSCAGSAHRELGLVGVGVSRSEGSCAGSAHSVDWGCLGGV